VSDDARYHKQQHTIEALACHCQRLTDRLGAAEEKLALTQDVVRASHGVKSYDLQMWSAPGWKELDRSRLLRRECAIPYRVKWSGPIVLGVLSGTVSILGAIWQWLR